MVTVSEPCTFESHGVRLAGTVTRPVAAQPAGAVLLLSGSGPQDRDESIAGTRPFAVLSEALAASGWLVLRWDDRGVGDSGGDYLLSSADELAGDILAAITALESAYGRLPMFLAGHSQGALIGMTVAARWPERIAGLALLAGMALPGRDVLLAQHVAICRAEGLSEDTIASTLALKRRVFDCLASAQADLDAGVSEEQRPQQLRGELEALWLGDDHPGELTPEQRDELDLAVTDLLEWEWRYLVTVAPAAILACVRCPILAAFGDKDTQVDAATNLAALRAAVTDETADLETHVLPGHNHLFQVAKTGSPSEYEQLGPPFGPAVTRLLDAWLRRICGRLQ